MHSQVVQQACMYACMNTTQHSSAYRGSPIPMKTTLRIGVMLLARMSCSSISPDERLPMMPMVPVAQKRQPIWQPI